MRGAAVRTQSGDIFTQALGIGANGTFGGVSVELIDKNGRLFGRINIIDVLVLLLIGAVVVAGAAFVLGGSS